MSDLEPTETALLTQQLESPDLRDRMVALASLRNVPADVALPLRSEERRVGKEC